MSNSSACDFVSVWKLLLLDMENYSLQRCIIVSVMQRFPYKLVTLDVNGTLLRIRSVGQTYAEIAREHGITADPQLLQAGFRSAYKRMDKAHPNFGVSHQGWQAWWKAVVTETFREVDTGCKMDDIAGELIRLFSTGKPWTLENGAIDLLSQLKSHKAVLGVISNTDPRLHDILKYHNLSRYFDFVLTSYEYKMMKPSVGIFNQALALCHKHLGSPVDGNHALHIGNSYELDFLAAKTAGWHSVLVNSKDPDDSGCLVFNNLNELGKHFANLQS